MSYSHGQVVLFNFVQSSWSFRSIAMPLRACQSLQIYKNSGNLQAQRPPPWAYTPTIIKNLRNLGLITHSIPLPASLIITLFAKNSRLGFFLTRRPLTPFLSPLRGARELDLYYPLILNQHSIKKIYLDNFKKISVQPPRPAKRGEGWGEGKFKKN